jgi:glucose/mannose transport system substrate-binding protein
MINIRLSQSTFFLCLGLGISGCGSDEGAKGGDGSSTSGSQNEDIVEIFSWWTQPGEIEALQSLFDLYRQDHANSRVFNAAEQSGTMAKEVLTQRLDDDDPPDLFQENAGDLRIRVTQDPSKFVPLTDMFSDHGWLEHFTPEVLMDVSVDGDIYGMPVNLHRENAMFYNMQLFDAHDLSAPTTLEEFWEVCDTLKAAGVTPVATSHQGWILRIMFNSLAMGAMGGDAYGAYFSGDAAADDESLDLALEAFERVMSDYVNDNAGEADFGWTEAAQAMFDGDAAMFFHGDWAKGYVQQLGWTPGVDFGGVGAPGAADVFLYGTDTFAMPAGGPNPEGAARFLQTVASPEGQVAFNAIKGSSPVRLDVSLSDLDPVAAHTLNDLAEASLRMPVPTWRDTDDVYDGETADYDTAFAQYAEHRDLAKLKAFFVDTYPGR